MFFIGLDFLYRVLNLHPEDMFANVSVVEAAGELKASGVIPR
jgi:hypothetical protein